MGFQIDAEGRRFITSEEGEILHVYKDPLGYPSVCVGHLNKPGEVFPATMTHEQCDAILDRDLSPIEAELDRRVVVEFAQCQVNSTASWLFNCGTGALAKSQILAAILGGHIHDVPILLEAWSKGRMASGGPLVTIPFLLARRRREGAMFARAWLLEERPVPTPDVPPRCILTLAELEHLDSLQFDLAEIAYQDNRAARMAAFMARDENS